MKISILPLTGIFITLFALQCNAAKLTNEELLFMDVQSIMSASKIEQPIEKSPSTIYVITAEDIKSSGATQIQDVLRMAPGMDYIFGVVGGDELSLRGFYTTNGGRMIVLIDGRSAYLDFLGANHFNDMADLCLEDIDHIEIIRGPGSSLYGANAFNGVISIYTKQIKDSETLRLDISDGEKGILINNIIYANTIGKFGFKAVVRDEHRGNWEYDWNKNDKLSSSNQDKYYNYLKGYVQAEYIPGFDSRVWFSAGNLETERLDGNSTVSYVQGKYNYKNLKAQVFYKQFRETVDVLYLGLPFVITTDPATALDAEIEHTVNWTDNNSLICGSNYRKFMANTQIITQESSIEVWAVYLQNQYTAAENLDIYVGGRYDHHQTAGDNVSPRIAGVYGISSNHTIRLAYATAFRSPNIIDIYQIGGTDDLKSEKIQSTEFGYIGKLNSRIKINATIFYNQLKDLISGTVNAWDANSCGMEGMVDVLLTSWLNSEMNYSYLFAENTTTDRQYKDFPEHKVNIGLKSSFPNGISANLYFHYVSDIDIIRSDWNTTTNEAYTLVNGSIGYALNKNIDISMSVYNLLDDTTVKDYKSDAVRTLTGKLTCKF